MEVSDFEEETLKKRHKKNPFASSMVEVNSMHEDDDNDRLETARARFSNVIKRHTALAERLSRDSDKMIFQRLQKEFEAARASQTEEVYLDGEEWNDGTVSYDKRKGSHGG
ncbi:hypothetical protein OIU76_027638 [Salix suchowensis]|nr:hypothetical protein OIU76_027638 [Salix suchowensis]